MGQQQKFRVEWKQPYSWLAWTITDHNYLEILVVLRDSVYGSLSKLLPPLLLEYGPIFKQNTLTNHQQSRY